MDRTWPSYRSYFWAALACWFVRCRTVEWKIYSLNFPMKRNFLFGNRSHGRGCFWRSIGLLGGVVSGITLTLGLLLSAGHLFRPGLYQKIIVALGAAGASAIVLLPLSTAILGPGWFFNGQGYMLPLVVLAVLPALVCAVSTWWASMRVVKWWRTQGTSYNEHADAPGIAVE